MDIGFDTICTLILIAEVVVTNVNIRSTNGKKPVIFWKETKIVILHNNKLWYNTLSLAHCERMLGLLNNSWKERGLWSHENMLGLWDQSSKKYFTNH
jgi:hypothetical protein